MLKFEELTIAPSGKEEEEKGEEEVKKEVGEGWVRYLEGREEELKRS